MQPIILDCTLRDGGYVNNWEFDVQTASAIMSGLYDSGICYIEIGIMGKNAKAGFQTKFNEFPEIEPLLAQRRKDCHYAVMITTENTVNFDPPICSEQTPDIIRLAYFKKDYKNALASAGNYLNKGYSVFLQAMATFMYSDDEMTEMLNEVNAIKPTAFYMVDSFSTMYSEDVKIMRDKVTRALSPEISFGFHAHNNIQMAFANVQEFLKYEGDKRQLFIDSSIFGMGRGAGNVPTELLMNYLNREENKYDISRVISVYQDFLEPIYKQYGWGYNMPYFLTALHKTNSAYGWYYLNHGLNDPNTLNAALEKIPDDIRYTLKTDVAERILKEVKMFERQ